MSGHQNVLKDKMEHKTDFVEYRTQASNLCVMLCVFVCVHEGIWSHGPGKCLVFSWFWPCLFGQGVPTVLAQPHL